MMCRIYHYHHYAGLAFDLIYQVPDNGYMSIYQLLVQVHNIQLLALESLAASFSFSGLCFILNFKYVSSSISTFVP